MKTRIRVLFKFLIAIIASVASAANAEAGFVNVSATVNKLQDSSYLYSYNVTTSIDSTVSLGDFTVLIDSNANLYNITANDGWIINPYLQGDNYIDFYSIDDLSGPGNSVFFSFQSALAPTDVSFEATGVNVNTGNFDLVNGTTQGPGVSSVPEPTSMIPLGIGMVALAGYSVYRGKREQ